MRASAPTILMIILGLGALTALVAGEWVEVSHRPGFWTRDRLKNAKPVPPSAERRRRQEERIASLKADRTLDERACSGSVETKLTDFNSYQQAPFYAIGKVFFAVGGSEFVCSASIAEQNNLVWTAGHCIYDHDSNQYVTDWIFIPQYFNGTTPLGLFYASRVHVTGSYLTADREEVDYGIGEFTSSFPSTFGSFELVVNIADPGSTTYTAYGYPAAAPFDGEFINRCQSLGCYRDPTTVPQAVGIDCTSTGGSSGGPWLINGNTQIAGVVAYGYDSLPGELFAPYFDSQTRSFYDAVVSGGNTGAGTGDGSSDADLLSTPYFLPYHLLM